MLVVSLGKAVIHKLKFLVRGGLEYYKSMGNHKKRGYQVLKFQWREAKGVDKIFDSNLVREKSWWKL